MSRVIDPLELYDIAHMRARDAGHRLTQITGRDPIDGIVRRTRLSSRELDEVCIEIREAFTAGVRWALEREVAPDAAARHPAEKPKPARKRAAAASRKRAR